MIYEEVEGEFPIRSLGKVKTEADVVSFRAYRRFVQNRFRNRDPEAARAKHLSWREANREHIKTEARKREAANREEINAGRRARRNAAGPEARRLESLMNQHNRRAAGKMNKELVKFLQAQPCLDCGKSPSEVKSEIAHLIAVANGGTNHPLNLIAQCRSCNGKLARKAHPRTMMVHYPFAAALAA